MASRKIEDLHPKLQQLCNEFISLCKSAGIIILIICTYRSSIEQDQLYLKGRFGNKEKKVTDAKGGQSPHNCTNEDGSPAARAFDACPLINGKCDWSGTSEAWKIMYDVAEKIGLDLGANFPKKDCDHFQLMNWKTY